VLPPTRIHRVYYERVVADLDGEARRLLSYCSLPFEPACLQFHQNRRSVQTASSEQVRQPLFSEAVDHWRHYEPWLGPLKEALGDVVGRYPEAGAGNGAAAAAEPADGPAAGPTAAPTAGPTAEPTAEATAAPTAVPTAGPATGPTAGPVSGS
jgi:hypothetical protein